PEEGTPITSYKIAIDRAKHMGRYFIGNPPRGCRELYQWPNDQAHLPAGQRELPIWESLHAPPVRCKSWFGVWTLQHGQKRRVVVVPGNPVGIAPEADAVYAPQSEVEPLGAVRGLHERRRYPDHL